MENVKDIKTENTNKILKNERGEDLELQSEKKSPTAKTNKITYRETFRDLSDNINKDPAKYLDSLSFRPIYKEKKKVNLSTLLEQITIRANHEVTPENLALYNITLFNGTQITFLKNVQNASALFSPVHFLANYLFAFEKPFKRKEYRSIIFPGLKISVNVDLVYNKTPSISADEVSSFRFLTCIFFGLFFHIKIEDCICYPTSYEDWVIFNSGISKNCVSLECKQLLSFHPHLFDPSFHSKCSNNDINYSFAAINILGNNNSITIKTQQHIHKIEKKKIKS